LINFRKAIAPPSFIPIVLVLALAAPFLSCAGRKEPVRPNLIWIVWDTVRADHLGLYGYEKPTTPFLEEWARGARVFDDCVSASNYTVSSHGSLFTGLLPTEHGARNGYLRLDEERITVAELLNEAGYQTYLYSANPHISKAELFDQGFDLAEHPWSPEYREEALRIVREKILPGDESSELPDKFRAERVGPWDIKASGELAEKAAIRWLGTIDRGEPFFIFLNYMEAHRPYIPPAEFRRRILTEEEVARSYRVDRSWVPLWSYTFGLHEYTAGELAVMAGTYDATIAELDDLFRRLMARLEKEGYLENTVVILTSDHGEHLGEQHILGHQYSLYEPLLRVPLLVSGSELLPPGRESRPVMNHDLFPTLLEIAGVEPPGGAGRSTVSLVRPREDRVRVAECLGLFRDPFRAVRARHPGWDPAPWEREIRAIYRGGEKLIEWEDGERRLFDLDGDRGARARDLASSAGGRALDLSADLEAVAAALRRAPGPDRPAPVLSEEHRRLLGALGYMYDGDDPDREEEGKDGN